MRQRVTFVGTLHQAAEVVLALLFGSVAVHRDGITAGALLVLSAVLCVAAICSPGLLSVWPVLGLRAQRVTELVIATGCAAAVVAITRTDMVATAPLLLGSVVLVRLAGVSTARPISAESPAVNDHPYQSLLNRVARAAGVFVRSQRSFDDRDAA